MTVRNILAAFIMMYAAIVTTSAQGFRIYKSDGTVAQFSMRTDSIVFYEGVGSDADFGPYTPVNQFITGTWYNSDSESVTFGEDGTTDFIAGATYKFLPYQGTAIIYNDGTPISILKMHDVTSDTLIYSLLGKMEFYVLTRRQPTPPATHEWVDLGLPSGTLWATCNVGANAPEEYGDYFAWGETEPKGTYSWRSYKWMNDGMFEGYQINKYTYPDEQTSACWYDGGTFIGDYKTELDPEDDAATVNWGRDWQMPSRAQQDELRNSSYTTITWTTLNGVSGRMITSNSNGRSIFLPAAGTREGTSLNYAGSFAYYWSRSLRLSFSDNSSLLFFGVNFIDGFNNSRFYGQSVRPVRSSK